MAVREMQHLRDRLDAHIRLQQHVLCRLNLLLNDILLRRNAELILEAADDVRLAEEKLVGDVVQPDVCLNIGINKIDSMLRSPNCPFVLFVGSKKLVKRKEFEQYISQALVI